MLRSSQRDKKRHIKYMGLLKKLRSLFLSVFGFSFSSILNIFLDLWMVRTLGLGVFGAALATLIAQGVSAVLSLLIFFYRIKRYQGSFSCFDLEELSSILRIAVPSVLQQSTVSVGMMIVQSVVNPFGTQALAGTRQR